MLNKEHLNNLSNEVWKAAIKLRGKFKAKDYPSVILPLIMIRRIECVLIEKRAQFRAELLAASPELKDDKDTLEQRVKISEQNTPFFNTTSWTIKSILAESPTQVEANFREYLNHFSPNIEEIIDRFDYRATVAKVVKAKALNQILNFAADEDFSPSKLSNLEMGYVYEDLLQRFSQDDAKDTGEHFTPREVIRIMVDLMEIDFDPETATRAISIYDPACGTGGMLSIAKEHLIDKATTPQGQTNAEELILLNGQEMLPQNYAVCRADMILKGERHIQITCGNSLIPHIESVEDDGDQHAGQTFDYLISNPPFGVTWSNYASDVSKLSTSRYSWGMPDKGDGSLLFLMTIIEKMKPVSEGGSRAAILFNGSPLSNGDATSGSSEVRRHLLENDLLDSIIMLPDQMFYNTGIYTYIWLLNNNKPAHKQGKVQIINARKQFEKEPKSFGSKRNRITDVNRQWIHQAFQNYEHEEDSQIFDNTDFAYHKVKLTYWQADEHGEPMHIREPFATKLTTANISKAQAYYGSTITLHLTLTPPTTDAGTPTDPIQADLVLQPEDSYTKQLNALIDQSLGEHLTTLEASIKGSRFKNQAAKDFKKDIEISAEITHRHYIDDSEYIPFDATASDKPAYIESFLSREIDYQIIQWEELDQLGYEILPNKYFYQYTAPASSDDLLASFYALEEQANTLLSSIKAL